MNPERIKEMKKIGHEISFFLGLILSFFLALVGTLSGGHFTVPGWLLSFLISFLISMIIGLLVPMKPVLDAVDRKAGLKSGTLGARFLESLISDLIYTPVITFCMVLFAYLNVRRMGGFMPFLPVFLRSLVLTMIVGYVLIFFLMPLIMKLVMKRHGRNHES